MNHRLSAWPAAIGAALLLAGLVFLFFWKILLTNLILAGVDTFLYFYPYRAYVAEALQQGRLPLWNPHLFMGAPLLANSQAGVLYPPNWLFVGLSAPKQVAWSTALHVWLAGMGTLVYARRSLRLNRPGALLATVLFAFGGFLGAQVDHPNQLQVAVWLPWLLFLGDSALRRRRRWTATLLLAGVVALMLLAGHIQAVYISLAGLGLYGLLGSMFSVYSSQPALTDEDRRGAQAGSEREARSGLFRLPLRLAFGRLLPLLLAVGLALLLAAVQLWPTVELAGLSNRQGGLSFNEASSFSLPPWTAHFSFFPPFGQNLVTIFGEAFSEWLAYVGIVGLGMALVGLLTMPWRREAPVFALLGLVGLVLALGRATGPLYWLLFKVVPGFDLFRVPARWLLLYALAVAMLAGLGLDALSSQPGRVRRALNGLLAWGRARPWRWIGLAVAGAMAAGALWLILEPVPLWLALVWMGAAGMAALLSGLALRSERLAPWLARTVLILVVAELFWAAQSLRYSQPTAPEAFGSLRPAITQLQLAQDEVLARGDDAAAYRFLSLSGIVYDPGDLGELEGIYGDQLSPDALYQLIVATKEKEVLFYNLPLLYDLYSVDGYDGGLLPLAQFVELQKLFLAEDRLSVDGRLRENLRAVPPGRLLSLLGVRHVVTDKVFDVWIDDVFYDLQFSARLGGAGPVSISTQALPDFPATALGLVSYLEGGSDLPDQTPVAEVVLWQDSGAQRRFVLRTGLDTAEGRYAAGVAHPQARVGHTWPGDAAGFDYITSLAWEDMARIKAIELRSLLPDDNAAFVLRGLSLINQPTVTSRSVLLSTEGNYRLIYSGDVKVYENLGVMPRAFVVHEMQTVRTLPQALALVSDGGFDPARRAVRLGQEAALLRRGSASQGDDVRVKHYGPEQVEIEIRLGEPGWLILTDTHYPGWRATIDGRLVEVEAVDIVFRGVEVPAGEHEVSFVYRPQSVIAGAWLSGAAWLAWLGLLAWGIKRGI